MNEILNELQMFDEGDKSVWFDSPYHHHWKLTANKTFNWFGTDSTRRYNSSSGYSQSDIQYQFNSHGYRCDELQQSDVLFIGCSYTFGIGLPLQDVWAYNVSQHLNIPYINVAQQGGSFSYFQRTLLKTLDVVQPKKVILLYPYNWRFELLSKENIFVWTAAGVGSNLWTSKEKDRLYAYEQFRSQEQEEFEIVKSLKLIERICQPALLMHSYWKYLEEVRVSDWFEQETQKIGFKIPTGDFNHLTRHKDLDKKARDGSHPGKQYHTAFSNRVITCLNTEAI